jgi:hypothetical protein
MGAGYSWVAVEARTGLVIADLPDLDVDKVSDSISRYETAQGSLPLPTAPENWVRATVHGGVCMILTFDQDDGSTPVPVWGGIVSQRERSESDLIPVSMATLPLYFDRQFVKGKTYTQVGQNLIVKDLIESYVRAGANGGVPIRVQIVGGNPGTLRDRTYDDADDKTVYSVLQELTDVIGGPEWYVGWEWLHNPERITPVLYVGDRVGVAAPSGLSPAASFEMPGPVRSFTLTEDFTSGRGANDVMAVSSASADVRPQSDHVVTADPERPTFEYRFTPSTSITSIDTLNGHARSKAASMTGGATSVSLTAVTQDAPRLGVDWGLGDDVGYVIGGKDRYGKETVPSVPGGLTGTARAIGWEMSFGDVDLVTPILMGGS